MGDFLTCLYLCMFASALIMTLAIIMIEIYENLHKVGKRGERENKAGKELQRRGRRGWFDFSSSFFYFGWLDSKCVIVFDSKSVTIPIF